MALWITGGSCSSHVQTVQRTGNYIRIDVSPNGVCIPFTSTFSTHNLGVLPAGTYTWQIFRQGVLLQTGSFDIAQTPGAPTLSPAALAILVAAMALGGYVIASRR